MLTDGFFRLDFVRQGGCPWCHEATEYLDEHGYEYQPIDVRRDPAAMARMKEISGQTLTPTLAIGDDLMLPDFDTGQLETFLKKHDLLRAA